MLKRGGIFCLAVGLLTGSGMAQQAPAGAGAESRPVLFDVAVTDKAGEPVSGLKEGDFQVLDDGKPVALRGFRAFSIQSEDPAQIVVLVDAINAGFTGVSLAREQIERFLRANGGQLPAAVTVAYLTDTGLDQVAQASRDGNLLAQTLHSRQADLRQIQRSAGFYGAVERMQLSMKALGTVVAQEERLPGRKLLIWISPGWPVFDNPNIMLTDRDQKGIFNTVVGLSEGLRQAQITMYSIDPLGTWDAGSMRTFLWQNFLKPVKKPSQANPGDLALQVLATRSGGRAMSGSNDVAGEIADCARDAKAWYRIAFDPAPGREAADWHQVEVRVDHPGTKLRTWDGYYAHP